MLKIFFQIFTDVQFLGAFIQTVILILLGFILRRKGIFAEGAKSVLTALVWKITVPCFAFNAFMQDFNAQNLKSGITILILSTIIYTLLIILGKISFFKLGKDKSLLGGLFLAIGQTTLFSMPILNSVYEGRPGQGEVMLNISCMSIVFRVFVYIVGFILISGQNISLKTLGPSLKKIFFTPVMIGMLAGIICFLIQNKAPFVRIDKTLPPLYVTVRSLARMLNPCAMLLIGITLGESDFKSAFNDPVAWLFAFLRNFIAPVLVLGICILLQISGVIQFTEYILVALVIGFSAPISVTLSVMCVQYKREDLFASKAVLLSTLMTIVSMPLMFVLVYYFTGKLL